jgi:hypothetical protein
VLVWRFFLDLGKVPTAGVSPSGMFPVGGASSNASRSCSCLGGEGQGLDCVSSISPKVSLVKVLALSLIFLFLRDYDVILYPQLCY